MDFAPDVSRPRIATRLLRTVVTLLLATMCFGASAPASQLEFVSATTASANPVQEEALVSTTGADAPSRRIVARRRRVASRLRRGVLVLHVRSLVDRVLWRLNPIVPRLRRGPPSLIV